MRIGPDVAYAVKEIFLTLQGEGAQAGRRAVFCRFAGCNLWSGREQDRATAQCRFCDTDFVGINGQGGGRFATGADLAEAIAASWGDSAEQRYVVLTGGEPMLQVDLPLIDALHGHGFTVAIETNGTLPVLPSIDWICVSPKAGNLLIQRKGDELKLVWPQDGVDLDELEALDFQHRLLQPMDGPDCAANTQHAMDMVMARPAWRLTLQTHKMLGIP